MIKKKIEESCILFMILLLTSTLGAETETILKEISSKITEIEDTEKKIDEIKTFFDEIQKIEQKQKLEKLTNAFTKKQNKLLASGLENIKKEATLKEALQIAIKNEGNNTVAKILKSLPERISKEKKINKQ